MMTNGELAKRWAKESLAMMMAGDGIVTLVDPKRHVRLWQKGPEVCRRMLQPFVEHPGWTRVLAALELGAGIWLAERQHPVSPKET